MNKNINFENRIKFFMIGILVVLVFDGAVMSSIFVRNIIYFSKGMILEPSLQLIPLLAMIIIFSLELRLFLKYTICLKKIKDQKDAKIKSLDYVASINPKIYKVEMILIYIMCSLLALMGGIGIAPLVFIIKGDKAYRIWKSQQPKEEKVKTVKLTFNHIK
ncbi:hypothetical protein SHELI_v1c08360 [Spiroplasma helicoides]|uniref:Uncharacterized protein n=1 Tax=Spiroplasma helicoides TaxID=216938 RepID=A0A1B3SLH3_9MOLU|nr:hypothetical protein [Spiroplasma helicoides]AOG60785.1 hypothetical protein SHELI_v1c08360 [Spiroplasma helicoides]